MALRRLFPMVRRSRFEREMSEEIASHLEHRVEHLMAEGVPRTDAERRARIEFGAAEAFKEECREARGLRLLDESRRNLVYGLRLLRRDPVFSLTVILTLGLCIGANTALFSVVDAVLFRPLPYSEPDRLALVTTVVERDGRESRMRAQNGATWETVRDGMTSVDAAVFSGWPMSVNLVTNEGAVSVRQQRVGAGFFRVLGIVPAMGRGFSTEEDRPGGSGVVVLGHELWQSAFATDPGVLGRTVLLRGEPHSVIGILPPDFRTGVPADVWTPLRATTTGEGRGTNYQILARLGDGTSWPQARSEMRVAGGTAIEQMQLAEGMRARLDLEPLQMGMTAGLRSRLLLLWAAVGVVLLIGCVNIAGLLLARAAARGREVATRMALGGGRPAILRQLLTESLTLALLGGGLGTLIGMVGIEVIQASARSSLGIWQEVRLDARVLVATGALSLVTAMLFGLFPALRATRLGLRSALADGAGRGVVSAGQGWLRRLLIVAEVALGVVLLVGAGLLVRSLAHLDGLAPGFDATNVVRAEVSLQDAAYGTSADVNRLIDDSLAEIRRLPGVEQAAVALSLPYERGLNLGFVRANGHDDPQQSRLTTAAWITPGFFEALRVPVLRGRVFEARDDLGTPPVVVVNRAFADEHYGDEEAIGARIAVADGEWEIVGIVGDVQQRPSWGDYGPIGAVPTVYLPVAQTGDDFLRLVHTWFAPSWVVRTAGDQAGILAGMEQAMELADPRVPFTGFQRLPELRREALATQRFQAVLLSLLAGLALVLASVGIGGLIAHAVTERTRDLGIRIALGATHARAVGIAARPGIVLTAAGLVVGLVVARVASHVLQAFVHGVSVTDLPTFVGTSAVLLVVATTASVLPALRITRLDPARTLRED